MACVIVNGVVRVVHSSLRRRLARATISSNLASTGVPLTADRYSVKRGDYAEV